MSHATFQNGIIPLVIVEILALRLVEGCVLSRYNQLAVIIAGALNFETAASHFFRMFPGSDELDTDRKQIVLS